MSAEDDNDALPPGLPQEFQPMMHNHAWDYTDDDPDEWPDSHVAPDIALLSKAGQFSVELKVVEQGSAAIDDFLRRATIKTIRIHDVPFVRLRDAPSVRIARPPAGRLVSVLRHALTAAAFDGMIAPYVAQEQHEYYEALRRKEFRQARWIVVRMYLLVGYNVLCAVTSSITRLVRRAG